MIYLDPTHILMNLLSSKKFKDTETINCIQTAIHNIEQLKLNNINGFNYVNMQVSKLKSELEELNNRSCESCKFGKIGVDHNGLEIDCSLNWKCSRGHSDKFRKVIGQCK